MNVSFRATLRGKFESRAQSFPPNFPRGWKADYSWRKASHCDARRRIHRYRSRATFAVERSAFDSRLAFVRCTIITRIRDGARRNRTFNVCTSVYTLESICRFAVRPATSRSIRRLDHQLRSLRSTPTSLVGSFASRGRARSRRADHASLSIVQLCCSQIIGNKGN